MRPAVANVGHVVSVGDGIVKADGLSRAGYGELVQLEDGRLGLVMSLDEDFASILLLSEESSVPEGMEMKTTGTLLSLHVSDDLFGRVIDPFGSPLDGRPLSVANWTAVPLERIAPGVTQRAPVEVPLKTGIKVVDALTPIGRGQRQLIVGDRNTGKTALVVDTIINQRSLDLGSSAGGLRVLRHRSKEGIHRPHGGEARRRAGDGIHHRRGGKLLHPRRHAVPRSVCRLRHR